MRGPGCQSYSVTNLHYDLGQHSSLPVLQCPHLCSEGDYRNTGGSHLQNILSANRGARSAQDVPDSVLGAGDMVVNRASPVPALRISEHQGESKASPALNCSNRTANAWAV